MLHVGLTRLEKNPKWILKNQYFNSSSRSQFEYLFHIKNQNLTMSSILNVDHHGMKEICIFRPTTEKWGKIWNFG